MERVSLGSFFQFPLPSAAGADGEAEEAVPLIGEPPPAGEFRPKNDQSKAQTFGGGLPPKFCAFGCLPSRPIGELADGRGGMATDFQSGADPSDRRRLKIRGHPRTRGDLPRLLDWSNVHRDALPPRGARSWAGGERGR